MLEQTHNLEFQFRNYINFKKEDYKNTEIYNRMAL
jgi:hypothetical protein